MGNREFCQWPLGHESVRFMNGLVFVRCLFSSVRQNFTRWRVSFTPLHCSTGAASRGGPPRRSQGKCAPILTLHAARRTVSLDGARLCDKCMYVHTMQDTLYMRIGDTLFLSSNLVAIDGANDDKRDRRSVPLGREVK